MLLDEKSAQNESMQKSVAILGATGMVGQKAIALLSRHSQFYVAEVVASEKRVGQVFGHSCDWREPVVPLPAAVAGLKCQSYENLSSQYVISCLPTSCAKAIEPFLLKQGKYVFSNASWGRMDEGVPLVIPEINVNDFSLLNHNGLGCLIKNPNCSVAGIALALAPLFSLGVIEHVSVVTLQSISGGGYQGVLGMMITGNTCPYIQGESHKIETETKKILKHYQSPDSWEITAHVHRVPVLYGHTATLHIQFKEAVDYLKLEALYHAWNERFPDLFIWHQGVDRPQPSYDLTADDMRLHIGQVRQGGGNNRIGMTILSHNLVRGAAGAVIANMEAYDVYLNHQSL